MKLRPAITLAALAALMVSPLSANAQSRDQHHAEPPPQPEQRPTPPPPQPEPRPTPPPREPEQRPTPPPSREPEQRPTPPPPQPEQRTTPPPSREPEQRPTPPPPQPEQRPTPHQPEQRPTPPPPQPEQRPTPQPERPISPPQVQPKPAPESPKLGPSHQPELPNRREPPQPKQNVPPQPPVGVPNPPESKPTPPREIPPVKSHDPMPDDRHNGDPSRRPIGQPPVVTHPGSSRIGISPNLPTVTTTHAIFHKPVPHRFDKPPILHRPVDNCRNGYYSYLENWLDQFFSFGFYCFTYNPEVCVASPWYYYPDMPGYLNDDRVTYEPFIVDSAFQPFVWHSSSSDEPGSNAYYLDTSIEELQSAFDDKDVNALAALVPGGYKVNIDLDGAGSYEIASEDFHDLMLDNVRTTQTKRFSIVSVQVGNDEAKVQAMHTFVEPDGTTTILMQTYILVRGENGYTIGSLKVTKPAASF